MREMNEKMIKPGVPAGRLASRPRFSGPSNSLFLARQKQSLIKWPTGQQLQEVSSRLDRLVRTGIRWEAKGDYFASGDLAYQIQEIVRTTAELFKKSQRLKR